MCLPFLLSRSGKECLDMGQFIRLRVANELYVSKKDRWGFACDVNKIADMLNPWFDLLLYDVKEFENSVLFTLKKDVIQEHFLSFLLEQTQVIDDFCAEEIKEDVEALKSRNLPDYMKWINESRMLSCLWYGESTIVSSLYCSGKLCMGVDGVDYLVEGKAIMECYNSLFTYIHNMIRKTSVNPLKDTVVVLLD